MNEQDSIIVMEQLKSLMSEGNSMSARILEYEQLLQKRNEEITLLQNMVENANAMRSNLENQLLELKQLQNHFSELKTLADKTKENTIQAVSPIMSRAQYDEQIAFLTKENEALRQELAKIKRIV